MSPTAGSVADANRPLAPRLAPGRPRPALSLPGGTATKRDPKGLGTTSQDDAVPTDDLDGTSSASSARRNRSVSVHDAPWHGGAFGGGIGPTGSKALTTPAHPTIPHRGATRSDPLDLVGGRLTIPPSSHHPQRRRASPTLWGSPRVVVASKPRTPGRGTSPSGRTPWTHRRADGRRRSTSCWGRAGYPRSRARPAAATARTGSAEGVGEQARS